MSKPKFMVFKLKDLWVPVIVTILAIIMVVFLISKFTATEATFAPGQSFSDGLYVAEISLDNAEFDVAISIHKNAIKSVELRNMDEQARLMYPLFEPSIAYIHDQVTKTQSLEIEDFVPAKETTAFLMGAIKHALIDDEDMNMLENNTEDYILTDDPVVDSMDQLNMPEQDYIDWETELEALMEDEADLEVEID